MIVNPILLIVFFVLVFFVLIGLIFWKGILSFFYPDRFFNIYMVYKDGIIGNWLHYRKNMSATTFEKEKKDYFFTPENVYMSNRIKTYVFEEGNPFSLNLKQGKSEINNQVMKDWQESSITALFEGSDSGLIEFIKTWGWLIGIVVIIIVIVATRGKG